MGDFKPTDAQRRAVTTIDRSICVRAGAGTGKTSVLVGRYLELLRRRRASVRDVAALTYTEKAAKVMKDRIRQACLAEERSADGADAAAWWRRQRIDLETASISTIHGFCSRLLSEYPVEAGVDPYFTVLDGVEQTILLDRCIDDVLRRLLDAEDDEVLHVCRAFSLDGVRGMLARMFARRDDASSSAALIAERSDEEVIASWNAMLIEAQVAHVDATLGQLNREGAIDTLRGATCLDASDLFCPRRQEALTAIDALGRAKNAEDKLAQARVLRQVVANLRGGSGRKWSVGDLKHVKEAFRTIRTALEAVPGGSFGRRATATDRRALAFTRCLIRLYDESDAAYRRAKARGGTVDFDDMLLAARALLGRRDDVRTRVQRRIRFLLVDELQDSALIERDIILLIVRDEDAWKRTGEVHIVPGKLFVVGDDKQSIYRFRGAEVSVFREFTDRMSSEDVIDLDVSFRTVPSGVAFANDLFGRLLGREEKATAYESRYFELRPNRTEDAAFLEVLIPTAEAHEHASDAREREARMIASRIRAMVDGGEKRVYDGETRSFRPVAFGDVAVLFRAMTQTQIYEHAFREADLPYYIVAGRGFYRLQEIMDLLVALRALERPRDGVALVGALRSPLFGISDETLFFMRELGSVREGLERADDVANVTDDQRQGLRDARAVLAELQAIKNRVSIAALLEEIVARTGFDAVLLAQFMGRQKLANVEKLIDLARTFEAKGLFTLDEFIRYVEMFVDDGERESERAAEEESSNVVRMMSVHQAKGMEFPVVFVADMSHESGGAAPRVMVDREMGLAVRTDEETEEGDRESAVLYDLVRLNDARRERAEDLRVLYVALTRARDHLVLSGWLRNNRPPARSWLRLVAEQYDLVDDSGTVAESLVFGEEAFAAPVHTEVPEVAVDVGRRGHHAAWKVVRRLDRMGRRFGEVASIPPFERAEYVESIATELQFKRRFVPSEFTEYRYCAQRYRLSRIVGVPAFESGSRGTGGAPDGALLGTVVHRALAGWDFVATASLEACIDQALASEGLTQTVAGNALRESALAMVTSAQAAGLFDEIAASRERHSEFPLAARVGDFIIDGIIDMVHRVDDGTFEIVDYKTDGVDAAGTAEAAANYALQVGAYAVALSKSGRAVSRVSLLFVRAGRRHAWRCDAKQLGAWEHELCSTVADIRSGRFDETHEGPCRCGLGWACGRGASEVDDLDMV